MTIFQAIFTETQWSAIMEKFLSAIVCGWMKIYSKQKIDLKTSTNFG